MASRKRRGPAASAPARSARGGERDGDRDGERDGDRDGDRDGEHEPVAPRPIWSGTISFGLVVVPVNLFPAVRSLDTPLRMLAPDGQALERHFTCPRDGVDTPWEHLVRGYEVGPGEYVPLTDAELEAIAPRKSRDIDLRRFVPRAELDPFLFERAWVLTPSGDSTKPYRLLAAAMQEGDRAGIATFVMRTREYLVAIVAERGVLHAETLRFAGELRTPKDVGLPEPATPTAAELREFASVVKHLAANAVKVDELVAPKRDRLLELARRKLRAGKDVVEAPAADGAHAATGDDGAAPDLFATIRDSLRIVRGGGAHDGKGAATGAATRRASPQSRPAASTRSRAKRRRASRAAEAR